MALVFAFHRTTLPLAKATMTAILEHGTSTPVLDVDRNGDDTADHAMLFQGA